MRCHTTNVDLWKKLESLLLDDPAASLPFSLRLARDNGWSQGFARRVAQEYKRFLYLCCEAGHPVTPSDEVDQAWHLHLCSTRAYWEDLCRETLGRAVHHGPTRGGSVEGAKFGDWYARTLASYRAHFGADPPRDIWPEHAVRFGGQRFERVDRALHLVVPRRALYALMGAGSAGLMFAGCATSTGDSSLLQVGAAVLGIVAVALLYEHFKGRRRPMSRLERRRRRGGRRTDGGSGCAGWWSWGGGCSNDTHDSSDSSGCGGSGCGGD